MRCAIYARVSSELQDVENSISRQLEACRSWIARNEYAEAEGHVYIDEAMSGSSLLARPQFSQLFDMIQRGGSIPFDALVVDDDSRLDRGGKLAMIAEAFAARGVRIYSADGGADLTDEHQQLLVHVKAGMNSEYLRELARRTRSGQRAKFSRGFHTGGRLFGYSFRSVWPEGLPSDQRTLDNRLGTVPEIDEGQAETVRRIFTEYANGKGLRAIARQLNADGIEKPRKGRGKGWDHTCIRAMLLNERYTGRWTWNRRRWRKKPEALLTEAEKERVRISGHAPRLAVANGADEVATSQRDDLRIIPDGLWSACQARFERRRRTGEKGTPHGRYLLSGLLRCSCGGSVTVLRGPDKTHPDRLELGCARARNRGPEACDNRDVIQGRDLERTLLGFLWDELLTPEAVEFLFQEVNERLTRRAKRSADPKAARKLSERIEGLEAQVANLVEAVALNGNVPALHDTLSARQRELDAAREDLAALEAPKAPRWIAKWTRDAIKKRLAQVFRLLDCGDRDKGRALLQSLFGSIRVERDASNQRAIWRLKFISRPLAAFMPVRLGDIVGSGGGI